MEETLKNIWPSGLGKLRFGHAVQNENLPFTIISLLNGKQIHKDSGHRFKFLCDVHTKTLDLENTINLVKSITTPEFSFVVDDYDTAWDEKRDCHIIGIQLTILKNIS